MIDEHLIHRFERRRDGMLLIYLIAVSNSDVVATTYSKLSRDVDYSIKQIRITLASLAKLGYVEVNSSDKGLAIRVIYTTESCTEKENKNELRADQGQTKGRPRADQGYNLTCSDTDNYSDTNIYKGRPRADQGQTKGTIREEKERKEKENFPLKPLYKEKEKKEKEEVWKEIEENCIMQDNAIKEEKETSSSHGSEDCQTSAKSDSGLSITINSLVDYFNDKMSKKEIPCVQRLGGRRRQFLTARLKEYGERDVRRAIDNAADSSFLNGANGRCFIASFEWIMRPNNFPKVLEGNYRDKNGINKSESERRRESFRADIEQWALNRDKNNGGGIETSVDI